MKAAATGSMREGLNVALRRVLTGSSSAGCLIMPTDPHTPVLTIARHSVHDSFVDTVTFVPRESMASPSSTVYTVRVGRLPSVRGEALHRHA